MKNCRVLASLSLLLFGASSGAVVFYSTGDPRHKTTPPTGALADSGWQLQGDAFPGVPIAPSFFISATHAGGKVGDVFHFRGMPYRMVAGFPHPHADITIWQVSGIFPAYAQLYRGGDELGRPLVVFGRGATRGLEVSLNGKLKGWAWGATDGLLRWGENVVEGITDQDGHPAGTDSPVQLLRANFNANAGSNEAHLSGGDSGGSVFIQQDGVWKLAGINHMANRDYSESATGSGFTATLFDEGGFYEGEEGHRELRPEGDAPQPGSFYATRLSAYIPWIESVIPLKQPGAVRLEESVNLFGPYTPVFGAVIDEEFGTISVTAPPGNRFYRVASGQRYVIEGMTRSGSTLLIQFSRAFGP